MVLACKEAISSKDGITSLYQFIKHFVFFWQHKMRRIVIFVMGNVWDNFGKLFFSQQWQSLTKTIGGTTTVTESESLN